MTAMTPLGITVYGCAQDEANMFNELSPRFGIVPAITGEAVSETTAVSMPRNRCISVGHKSEISGPMLRALRETGVEYISTRSIGLDHVDLRSAAQTGITVENVAYAPDGVADYTLMLILMAVRNAKQIVSTAENYDFRLGSARGKDLRDMTVGVVGTGRIGSAVIRRLQGFGCRVLSHDNGRKTATGSESVSLDDLLLRSDVITLHVPLTPHTHHFIGRKQIEMMKQGSFLINTGRGALIETSALITALESGRLGGTALDVLEGEESVFYYDCSSKPDCNKLLYKLQRMSNAIVTPHTAYYTKLTLRDTVEKTLINCRKFERNRAHAETTGRTSIRGLLRGT